MSYLVFARKWRPVSFDDVVGQEHVTRTLKKAIEKNRVAHAYVFTGTRGVGKTTTARILARALNCEKGPTPEPCGTCETCRAIMNGSSFDVLEIDGASNNSVEDVRELRDNINYSSMGGKYRIYVIDEVHMLSKPAFNALLKTLEEPPKNVIFIFATTEPRKIPETIMSRCQRYDFRRISPEKILEQLEKICTSEKIAFDRQALLLIARKADGSMRDALSLLDQVHSFCHDSIEEKEVRSVLGLVESEVFANLMDAVAGKKVDEVLGAVHEVLHRGYDLQEFLVGLEEHVRNLLFARIPGVLEGQKQSLQADITDTLVEQSRRFAEGDLLRMTEMLRKAEYDLRWSSYPRFLVEITLLKIVYMDSTVSIQQLLASIKGGGPAPQAAQRDETGGPPKKKDSPRFIAAEPDVDGVPPSVHSPHDPAADYEPRPAAHTSHDGAAQVAPAPQDHGGPSMSDEPPISSLPAESDAPESFDIPEAQRTPLDAAALWPGFIESLMIDRPNLGSFLSMAHVASAHQNSIDVRFPADLSFQFSQVTFKPNRDIIHNKLSSLAGQPMELHISLETKKAGGGAAPPPRPSASPLRASLEDDMEREPIIKAVLDVFEGEVI